MIEVWTPDTFTYVCEFTMTLLFRLSIQKKNSKRKSIFISRDTLFSFEKKVSQEKKKRREYY